MQKQILADGRWQGAHGIGRFSHEVLSRLSNVDMLLEGPTPLSLRNLWWLPRKLSRDKHHQLYFNPGFNPILCAAIPYIFTIHDLTHLYLPGKHAFLKKIYYETLLKKSAKNAAHIITVSEYSKKDIMRWANISAEKITVVGNGISDAFKKEGARYQPGFPYLLYVGNSKAHKNIPRLIEAFSLARIDPTFHLILTCDKTTEIETLIQRLNLSERIHFEKGLNDASLAERYRGAAITLLPSLYEGFGIPVIEAMACGSPVITSTVASLPEIAQNAAILVNPYETSAITKAIEHLLADPNARNSLIDKGLSQAKLFSWDKTASQIQGVLDQHLSCI